MSFPIIYFVKESFMYQLLNSNKLTFDFIDFENIRNKTQYQFYRTYSDSCIIQGPIDYEVFAIMKDDTKLNKYNHVVVKLNLNDGKVKKFSRDHNKYISSLLYSSDKNFLVTGEFNQLICIYNSITMEVIKQVFVHKGSIFSLFLKSNVLYIGGDNTISVYELCIKNHIKNNNDDGDRCSLNDINFIKHIQVTSQKEENICLNTISICEEYDFWLGGIKTNKIYNMLIDKQDISNLKSKLDVILRQLYKLTINIGKIK